MRPAWETRLVTKGLEVAITTSLAADGLVMYTLHRTTRLFALRNLLNHSEKTDWQLKAKHIRSAILDAWPEGKKPEHDSWEVRWNSQVGHLLGVGVALPKQVLELAAGRRAQHAPDPGHRGERRQMVDRRRHHGLIRPPRRWRPEHGGRGQGGGAWLHCARTW